MEKAKLGISVGLLGAAMYAVAGFAGYVPAIILAGYILLFESNEWLKKAAVKAVAILVFVSLAVNVIDLIPDTINWVLSIINMFGTNLYILFLERLFGVITSLIYLLKTFVFVVATYKSLHQGTVKVPVLDTILDKYM